MKKNGMLAAVALAAGITDGPEAALPEGFTVTASFVKSHFAAVASELVAEGAWAERTRIASIEQVVMPGHDAIIKAHKADGSKTAADAAFAIINAENAARAKMQGGLEVDEQRLKGLKSAPTPMLETAEQGPITNQNAHALGRAARQYIIDQKGLGRKVTPVQALAHVTQQEA
jgi:hypothetical protein